MYQNDTEEDGENEVMRTGSYSIGFTIGNQIEVGNLFHVDGERRRW